jgi:microtubule-associated protein-like 6
MKKRVLHEKIELPLERAFNHYDTNNNGKLDTRRFIAAWVRLGMKVTEAEAHAIFNKFGKDKDGCMPYKVFISGLMLGKARLLGMASDVQKGAFTDPRQANFMGKILYKACRKGVYAPTDWDPALAARSAATPEHALELEFVYGFEGKENLTRNMFYTCNGEVVYYAAAVGVVYNKQQHTQRHFLMHDDDIKSLAINPTKDIVATGQV